MTKKETRDEALGCVVLPYDINPAISLSYSGDSDEAEQPVDEVTTAAVQNVGNADVSSSVGVSSAELPTANVISDSIISDITIINADVPSPAGVTSHKVPTACDVSNAITSDVFNADVLFFDSYELAPLTVMLTMPSHPLSAMSAMPRFPMLSMPMSTLSLMSAMPRSSLSVVIAMLRSPLFAVRISPLSVMMDVMTKAVVMISRNDKSNGKPGEEKGNDKIIDNVNESASDVESEFSDEESEIVNESSDASDEDSDVNLESYFSREEGEATDWESDFDEVIGNASDDNGSETTGDESDSDASDDEIVSS